ncbi:MAG TPA: hypothetical protein VFG09_03210 [Thermodesulfovibrionales bacterium]|nr:hypothetical protein [Thermodesulfovibrionales bacterium]
MTRKRISPSKEAFIKILSRFRSINDTNYLAAYEALNNAFPGYIEIEQFDKILSKARDIDEVASELFLHVSSKKRFTTREEKRQQAYLKHDPSLFRDREMIDLFYDVNDKKKESPSGGQKYVRKPTPIRLELNIKGGGKNRFIKEQNGFKRVLRVPFKNSSQEEMKAAMGFDSLVDKWFKMGWCRKCCLDEAEIVRQHMPKKITFAKNEIEELVSQIYGSYFIPIHLVIDEERWDEFASLYLMTPKVLLDQVTTQLDDLIAFKIMEIAEGKEPPGSNRKKIHNIRFIREEVTRFYAYFSVLCKYDRKDWPAAVNKLVDTHGRFLEKDGIIDAERLAALCVHTAHNRFLRNNGMTSFFDVTQRGFTLKNLRRTYIDKSSAETWRNKIQSEATNLTKNGNAKYLTKKAKKNDQVRPYAYSDILAMRSDMVPCDEQGKQIASPPCHKKRRQLFKKIFLELSSPPNPIK